MRVVAVIKTIKEARTVSLDNQGDLKAKRRKRRNQKERLLQNLKVKSLGIIELIYY
jgi:hypothetical protein|tara:strand:- start:41 stop:208 length:168 start_codon:yes stop_codon:yes gene_type:complete